MRGSYGNSTQTHTYIHTYTDTHTLSLSISHPLLTSSHLVSPRLTSSLTTISHSLAKDAGLLPPPPPFSPPPPPATAASAAILAAWALTSPPPPPPPPPPGLLLADPLCGDANGIADVAVNPWFVALVESCGSHRNGAPCGATWWCWWAGKGAAVAEELIESRRVRPAGE